jgi:hypothetical protein
VDRVDELQTDLNEIKSSHVLWQVQDLQEHLNEIKSSDMILQLQDWQEELQLLEMENVNDMITLNDETKIYEMKD